MSFQKYIESTFDYRRIFGIWNTVGVFAFDSLTHRSIAIFLTRKRTITIYQKEWKRHLHKKKYINSPLLQSSLSLFSEDNIEIILLSSHFVSIISLLRSSQVEAKRFSCFSFNVMSWWVTINSRTVFSESKVLVIKSSWNQSKLLKQSWRSLDG